jgi:CDGSH-type Zn-finger protein
MSGNDGGRPGILRPEKENPMSCQATTLRNGPLKVEGDFKLVDSAGKAFTLPEGKPVFLCRCGHSGNKPFCDGAHGKQAFASEVHAP